MSDYVISMSYDENRQEVYYTAYMVFSFGEKELYGSSSLEDLVRDVIAGECKNAPVIEFRGFKSTTKHLDLSL